MKAWNSHLRKTLEYMTQFGVMVSKNGLLTSKMKFDLLNDFDGVQKMYGAVGVQIFKSIKKITKNHPVETFESPSHSDSSASSHLGKGSYVSSSSVDVVSSSPDPVGGIEIPPPTDISNGDASLKSSLLNCSEEIRNPKKKKKSRGDAFFRSHSRPELLSADPSSTQSCSDIHNEEISVSEETPSTEHEGVFEHEVELIDSQSSDNDLSSKNHLTDGCSESLKTETNSCILSDAHNEEMSALEETPNAEHGVEIIDLSSDNDLFCKNQLTDGCSESQVDLISETNSCIQGDPHNEVMSAPEETPNIEYEGAFDHEVELIDSQFVDSYTYCKNMLKDACSESLIDLASRTNSEVDSESSFQCLGEAQFDSSLPIIQKDNFHNEVEHYEFDLAEMKEQLGRLDVNSTHLSLIHSPVKGPAVDESRTFTSHTSDPIALACNESTTTTGDLDFASEKNDSVQVEEPFTHTFPVKKTLAIDGTRTLTSHTSDENPIASEHNKNTITTGDLDFASETNDSVQIKESCTLTSAEGLDSVQRKRPIDSTFSAPLPNCSYSTKRRKVDVSRENPSSELQVTDSALLKSSVDGDDGYISWSSSSPSSIDSGRAASKSFPDMRKDSMRLLTPTSQVTSHSVDSVLTAALAYNVYLQLRITKYFKKDDGILQENNPIIDIFASNCSTSKEMCTEQALMDALTDALTNPELIPNESSLLFYIFHFVYISSLKESNNFFCLNPIEKAVATVLFDIEKTEKYCQSDLFMSALESLHILIVDKTTLKLPGLCALCRLFSEMCKRKELVQKPILLSVGLLKKKHKYAPMMIASLIGVWNEPFEVTGAMSDEEKCLHSAIAFGVSKRHHNLSLDLWKTAMKMLEKHIFPIPNNAVIQEVIEYIMSKIHHECIKGSPFDVEHTLLAPVIIFAATSCKDWTTKNIINEHVIPSLLKYERQQNETAFGLFTEIFSLCRGKADDWLRSNYLGNEKVAEGKTFVKECVSAALTRLSILREKPISETLLNWLRENIQNSKAEPIRLLLKKKTLSLTTSFTPKDILIQ